MFILRFVLYLAACTFISSCSGQQHKVANISFSYDISNPDETIVLPDTLREISGITCVDDSTIACVQDENGIVFYYNFLKKEIIKQEIFDENGDYEGIANTGEALWILKSDGNLFCYSIKEKITRKVITGIPSENNEGLCYDKANNRLLIAAKGKITGGKELKGKRMIFSYDILSGMLNNKPAKIIDLQEIRNVVADMNMVKKWKSKNKSGQLVPDIEIHTSAMAIHPLTGQLFLISDKDNMLLVFERDFTLSRIINLDPILFNKAEGITFLSDGEMLISNEGQDKKPTLLRFGFK